MNSQICRDFQKGKCIKGLACPFKHIKSRSNAVRTLAVRCKDCNAFCERDRCYDCHKKYRESSKCIKCGTFAYGRKRCSPCFKEYKETSKCKHCGAFANGREQCTPCFRAQQKFGPPPPPPHVFTTESPVYEPPGTPGYCPGTPVYMPKSPDFGAYSPCSPAYHPEQNDAYSPTSPAYVPPDDVKYPSENYGSVADIPE